MNELNEISSLSFSYGNDILCFALNPCGVLYYYGEKLYFYYDLAEN